MRNLRSFNFASTPDSACVARRMKDSLDKASIDYLLQSGRVSNAVLISNGRFSRHFVSSHTDELLCIYRISYSCKVVFFHATRYILVYHVLHAERVESSIGRNGEKAKRG